MHYGHSVHQQAPLGIPNPMNSYSWLGGLLLISTACFAQTRPREAWSHFVHDHGSSWLVDWNPATGTPNAIFGPGLKVAEAIDHLAAARAEAEGVLRRNATLLGRGDSIFVESEAARVRHLFYFVYGQNYRGLQVRGGRADVRINTRGVISMFGAATVQFPKAFDIQPKITAAAARVLAEQKILGRPSVNQDLRVQLMIWAEPFGNRPTKPRLAWQVSIDDRSLQLAVGDAFIDAWTGAWIHFENGVHNCGDHCQPDQILHSKHVTQMEKNLAPVRDLVPQPRLALNGIVRAWVVSGHRPHDPLMNVPLPNVKVTSSAGNAFTDATGHFSIPHSGSSNVLVTATLEGRQSKRVVALTGTALTASSAISPTTAGSIQFGTANAADVVKSQTNAYYFTDDMATYVKRLVGGNPARWTKLDGLTPRVNLAGSCNANYTNYTTTFGTGGSTCNYTAFETVIQHEWSHAVDMLFGGITQMDGLSEGWADAFAILRSKQPLIGSGFFKSATPDYVRTALNTRQYPAGTGPAEKGEVWMGWVWDVRTDLVAKKGAALGHALTESMVIPTIVANAPTLLAQVREVYLLDDDDGNLGNGTPNSASLTKASIKRNILKPFANGQISFRNRKSVHQVQFNATSNTVTLSWSEGPHPSTLKLTVGPVAVTGTSPVTLTNIPAGISDVTVEAVTLEGPCAKYGLHSNTSQAKYNKGSKNKTIPLSSDCEGTCPVLNGKADCNSSITPVTMTVGKAYSVAFQHKNNPITLNELLLFTKGNGTESMTVSIHRCAKVSSTCINLPAATPEVTVKLTPGTSLNWYSKSLTSSVVSFSAGEIFYIVFKSDLSTGNSSIRLPYLEGDKVQLAPYLTKTSGVWNSISTELGWAICFRCAETATECPVNDTDGDTSLGNTLTFTVENARPLKPAVFLLNFSNATVPLGILGAPTCTCINPIWFAGLGTNASGFASIGLSIPNNVTLIGVKFNTQWLGADDLYANNPGQITVSNALAHEIGN